MDFDYYQEQARRTQNPDLTVDEWRQHALFGLSAEVGEVLGLFQKMYQGHRLNPYEVADELGDVLWFVAELCDVLGVRMADVADNNIFKLKQRYPNGFSEDASVNRKV